jgi:hypothetical protein
MGAPRKRFLGNAEQKRTAFLKAYEKTGFIRESARKLGIPQNSHYQWMVSSPGYPARFKEAHERMVAALPPIVEAEVVSRAVEGTETLVFDKNGQAVLVWVDQNGEVVPPPPDPQNPGELRLIVYRERVFDNKLLVVLARKLMPEYVEKSAVDHTSAGKTIQLGPDQT